MIARALCLLLLMAAPALAYLAPGMFLQRTRVGDQLQQPVRHAARAWVAALPMTLQPPEFETRLAGEFGDLGALAAFQLYCGVEYAERRESVVQAFEERVALLVRSRDVLQEYLYQVNRSLRRAPTGGSVVEPPERGDFPPQLRQDDATLHVLRDLPYPTAGMHRNQLRVYRDVAEADLKAVKERLEQARRAEETFVDQQVAWLRYLDERVRLLEELPEEQLLDVVLGRESSTVQK